MGRRTKKEIEAAKRRSETAHKSRLKNTYGITPEEYDALYTAQGGVCAVCRRANGRTRRLSVDHDHVLEDMGCPMRATIRGLLCRPCNTFIGRLGDNPEALERAASYLRKPPAREVLHDD